MSAVNDAVLLIEKVIQLLQEKAQIEESGSHYANLYYQAEAVISSLQSLEDEASIKLHWDTNERILSIADYRETFPTGHSHTFLAYTTPQPPAVPDDTLRDAFISGFRYCAVNWADRDDLYSDVHSEAFRKGMESRIKRMITAAQQESES